MDPTLAHRLLALVLIGGLHGAAGAQDLPKRKAGLWEVSMEMPQRPGQPMKTQQCIDDKSDAMAHKKAMDDQADSRCEHKTTRRDASGTEINYICTSARGKTTGTIKLSGDMQSRFTMDNHARFDPPRHGMSEASVKTQGQWMGACPADMKPGEIRMTGMPDMRARRAERGASGPRSMTPEQMQQMQQMMEQMKKQRGG